MAARPVLIHAEAVAEDAMAFTPLRVGGRRESVGGAVVTDQGIRHRWLRTAALARMDGDVDAGIAAVRSWFAGGGPFTWWLGPSTQPSDLAERLLASGASDDPDGGAPTALVLDRAPVAPDDASSAAPTIRTVETFEDFAAMQQLLGVANDPARTRALWEDFSARPDHVSASLALVDGEPVSAGGLAIATTRRHGILSGGATHPEFRGRGCYAALVRHRWDVAQSLGLEALVVQASPLSRPVLERLGFRVTGTLRMLADAQD